MVPPQRGSRGAGQEPALLDYVQRLERFRAGRCAVHVRFSQLRPQHRQEHQIRIAASTGFGRLTQKYDTNLFALHNLDTVLLIRGAANVDVDEAIKQLRCLFSEDPCVNRPDGQPDAFIARYNLESDYERFIAVCKELEEARRVAASTPGPVKTSGGEPRPMDPIDLSRVENAIRKADLAVATRRQPVVISIPQRRPVPVFQEVYISSADLGRLVMPDCHLTADRWLFQRLTRMLDQRMLAVMMRRQEPALGRDFSLNLNVSTVLSPEFSQFHSEVVAGSRSNVIIELQQIDIFADPGSFIFAREFLRERGYKICLDGVKHLALPLIDRQRLGVDFVKFEWGYGLIDDHEGPRGAELREAVARIGRDRLILCRCDSPEALRVGRTMGISLYQGRYFDALLEEARTRADEVEPAKAVAR